MDNSPVAGAAMYGAVFILLRHFTLESMNSREAKRLLARQLPRPKSFLLSEKAPSAGAKEEVAGQNAFIGNNRTLIYLIRANYQILFISQISLTKKFSSYLLVVPAKIIENAGIFVPGCTLCLKDSIVIGNEEFWWNTTPFLIILFFVFSA